MNLNEEIIKIKKMMGVINEGFVNFPIDDDIILEVWEDTNKIELVKIVIPKKLRGTGKGTEIMNMVCDYADSKRKPIYLTPDLNFGGTSIDRLKKFYKKFGFTKNKDFEVSHSMVRLPKNNFKKKQYLGQCDTLRRCGETNEQYWQEMMSNKKRISFEKFIQNVNIDQILDEDENPIEYLNNLVKEDPDTATYVSNWGKDDAMFLQSGGFEFIFI